MYEPDKPALEQVPVQRRKDLVVVADKQGMVIELCLFNHYLVYPVAVRNKFIKLVTEELRPYRNVIFEIWNEYSDHTVEHYRLIKQLDSGRLVGSSPGFLLVRSSMVSLDDESQVLDILMPHTT